MRTYKIALPNDLADEVDRVAREHRISRSRYLSLIVAYWLGRADERDEIAALHERMNQMEGRLPRR